MISSTFHWKSNFTHGSDESLTFSTEILNLHSDRKFHCTESRHKPHLRTGRFTVKKKKGRGGVRGFCQLSFLGLYHTKAKPVTPFGSWDDPTASVDYNLVLWRFFPHISHARSRFGPRILVQITVNMTSSLTHSLSYTLSRTHTQLTHTVATLMRVHVYSLSLSHTHTLTLSNYRCQPNAM